ncbi:MAG: DVUA0089 family protein, partial [Chthoniobacterales bacterium]
MAALAVVFGIGNPLLNAQVFTEIGDAGQTPGTAQNSGIVQAAGGTGRSTVLGTFLSPTDADVYRLTINAPGTFSISTLNTLTQSNGGPGGLDTQLFIFDAAGHPIVMNDDANGLALQSTIPSATPFMSALAAGIYYIAISLAGNDPVNIN